MPTLAEHPAVTEHGRGITTIDLAEFVDVIGQAAASRIAGVGAEQYEGEDGQPQKFETNSLEQTVNELLDEITDVYAYTALIAIKILSLLNKVTQPQAEPAPVADEVTE